MKRILKFLCEFIRQPGRQFIRGQPTYLSIISTGHSTLLLDDFMSILCRYYVDIMSILCRYYVDIMSILFDIIRYYSILCRYYVDIMSILFDIISILCRYYVDIISILFDIISILFDIIRYHLDRTFKVAVGRFYVDIMSILFRYY
jgi:hypothetical protein